MKYLFFYLLIFSFSASAQDYLKGSFFKNMPIKPKSQYLLNEDNKQVNRTPERGGSNIWSEDFSNGLNSINGQWTVGGTHPIWKHAFYGTSGEWSAGTPQPSTTSAGNGFMLFDADSLNYMTTPNYVELDGELISPAIDLSSESSVVVEFEYYYRYCCVPDSFQMSLSVSPDSGSTWHDFEIQNTSSPSAFTNNPETFFMNISSIAGGQSKVMLKWRWQGASHYFWVIDDINIKQAPAHEIELVSSGWMSVNGGIPYTMIPHTQAQDFYSYAVITNQGASTDTVSFKSAVGTGGSVFNGIGIHSPVAMTPLDTLFDTTAYWNSGTNITTQSIINSIDYDSLLFDHNSLNNVDTHSIQVTQYTYGRDSDTYTTAGIWNGDDGGSPPVSNGFTIGNVYHAEKDLKIYNIQVALTESTDIGAITYAQIYEIDSSGFSLVYDGSGGMDEIVIQNYQLNNGSINLLAICVNEAYGFQLDSGKFYLAAIGHYGGPERIVLANGLITPPSNTVFMFDTQTISWHTLNVTPLIRLSFDPSIPPCYASTNNLNLDNITILKPNPSDNQSVMILHQAPEGDWTLTVTDINGRQVYTENTYSNGQDLEITIPSIQLDNGVHNCVLSSTAGFVSKKLVVTH